ncbi:hypothetical protein D3C81_1415810 [compost metagenome]
MLIAIAEVIDLHLVDQGIVGAIDVSKTGSATQVLVTGAETMAEYLVGKQPAQRIVVYVATTVPTRVCKANIRLETLPCAQR